ncbi:glycosyltransferase family 2 protein [Eubacteriaceae bacterium ES3]|nr:glycosyltransferase family 2 protein [Eubacteriaceae bacterium ES3]
MLVTIIIPVYNMALYLNKCMQSVSNQTYKELQIILVDDGSKDSSPIMCDEYKKNDNRIEVIHKVNGGLGFARNSGVKKARGEYIFFLDADDWIPDDSIEKLVAVVKTYPYDIIKGLHYLVKKDKTTLTVYSYSSGVVKRNGNKEETERYQKIKTKSTFGSAWAALYKRTFLIENYLQFDENKVIFLEDMLFNLKAFSHQPEYYVLCYPVYYYLVRQGSIMNSRRKNLSTQLLNLNRSYCTYLQERGWVEDNMDLIIQQLARYFCWSVSDTTAVAKNKFLETKAVIEEFGNDQAVVKILSKKNVLKYLKKMDNKADVFFYSVCMFLLKYKYFKALTMMFVAIDPIMKRYKSKKTRA